MITSLIALCVLTVTLPFALAVGVLAAPFGLADDVGRGYEQWICEISNTPERCRELINE